MITQIMNELHTYPAQALAIWTGLQWLFGCFVDSLDPPAPLSSPGYKFFYKFSNRLAGNNSEANKKF